MNNIILHNKSTVLMFDIHQPCNEPNKTDKL